MCVRESSAVRPYTAKMSATICRCVCQIDVQVRQHGQHAERPGRQRERSGDERGALRGGPRDARGRAVRMLDRRVRGAGTSAIDALDHAGDLARRVVCCERSRSLAFRNGDPGRVRGELRRERGAANARAIAIRGASAPTARIGASASFKPFMRIALWLHLLATVVWVGGMFFAHVALRPAVAALPPPVRLPLVDRDAGDVLPLGRGRGRHDHRDRFMMIFAMGGFGASAPAST